MTSIRHNPEESTPPRTTPTSTPRAGRDPRRRLEPYDAHRHRPPGRGEPDDALPPVARHPDPARRPDDPRVGAGRRAVAAGHGRRPPHATGSPRRSSPPCRHCAPTPCSAHRRRRPRGAAPLPARPARSQPGDGRRGARRRWSPRASGTARSGAATPCVLARSLVLAAHGFTLSAHTMVDDGDRRRTRHGRLAARRRAATCSSRGTSRHDTGRIHVGLDEVPESTDVLVIGLGITGAASRSTPPAGVSSVVAVDAHDVAFGTSRWSSKLVHGGLRYLATRTARRRPRERGRARHPDADHRAAPGPRAADGDPADAAVIAGSRPRSRVAGIRAGDLLRLAARTRR